MNKKLLYKIFITFLTLSFTLSQYNLYAENRLTIEQLLQQKKVTINMKNSTIKDILYEIQKQSGVSFVFKYEADSKVLNNMTLNVKNVTVEDALKTLFTGTQFTYSITDQIVTITKKPAVKQNVSRVLVAGKVVDANKKPIAGATILVEGTPTGAISDATGSFNFMANSDDILEISYIGKKTVIYNKLAQNSQFVVTLEDDAMNVDEVVVNGYMSMKKTNSVGSQTTIKADDIMNVSKTNIAEMLQGQVAGMIVTNSSSRVGATPKIQIRGQSTLQSDLGNQDPIWVVDGIIQDEPIQLSNKIGLVDDIKETLGNQVSWLNPADIATITVLKDASATAIYGSRASNGVIVVTTKKPEGEKISISYSGSMSVKSQPKYSDFNFMNSQERILLTEDVFNAGLKYSYYPPERQMNTFDGVLRSYYDGIISGDQYLKRRAELESMNTNWFDILTRTAISQNHTISIMGRASDKLSMSASMGYNKENGMELGNSGDRFTARIAGMAQLNKRLKIDFSINGTLNKTIGSAVGGSNSSTPLDYATNTSRAIPAFNEDGSRTFYQVKNSYKYNDISPISFNMLNEIEQTGTLNKSGRLGISLNLDLKLTDWLTYQLTGGYNYSDVTKEIYRSERSYSIAREFRGYDFNTVAPNSPEYKAATMPHGGLLDEIKSNQNSYNIQNKLLFQKTFNEKHYVNAMFAHEVRSSLAQDFSTRVWGLLPDRGNTMAKPPMNIESMTSNKYTAVDYGLLSHLYAGGMRVYEKEDNFMSLFATFAYSYDSRYVFNFSVRNDMSNRFGQDTNGRFDPTYSMGVKWNISNEPFMNSRFLWITGLNISATYGIQGNALLSKSPELILTKGGVDKTYDVFLSKIFSIPNPNLSWERTTNWNYAISARLFNAVNISFDGYQRKSNAIVSKEIGFENGKDQMEINGGIIYNNGMELTLSFSPVTTKDFGLNVSINSSKNWNKGGTTTIEQNAQGQVGSYLSGYSDRITKEGFPIGAFWSYKSKGLDNITGDPLFYYMDIDPAIAKSDPTAYLVYNGQNLPDFTGGLNLSVRYKRLTLSSSFALLLGGKKRLPSPYSVFPNQCNMPDPAVNVSKDLTKRWKKPGDETLTIYPAIRGEVARTYTPNGVSTNSLELWEKSDAMVVNSSFFRCNNLNLSYSINRNFLQKIGVNSIQISGSVSNLFVIGSKRYNGFDPELGDGVMPKNYSLSLSIGF